MAGTRRIIPREELSDFQLWQFRSLLGEQTLNPEAESASAETAVTSDQVAPLPEVEVTAPLEIESVVAAIVEPEPQQEALPYPTAEEIEAIERQAHEEGYRAGLEAGRQQAAEELAALQVLLAGLDEQTRAAESALASDVLDLALVVARQLVRQEITADRKLVLNVIREAIAGLPPVKGPARIQLNPADLDVLEPLLQAEMPEDVWRWVADPALESGACRIETAASSLDLTLTSRWQGVLRVLGRASTPELDWSAPAESNDELDPD